MSDTRTSLSLFRDCDIVIDGTDNFETRFLLNDASIKTGIPWVFAGCLGADGQTMTILPEETACLRCLMPDGPPPAGSTPTCDAAGILAPIIAVMAAIQSAEALKILSGNRERVSRFLTVISLWDNQVRQLNTAGLRSQVDCPSCSQHRLDWLDGRRGSQSSVLCGRNAVQIRLDEVTELDLGRLAEQFSAEQILLQNPFMMRVEVDGLVLTLFPDGRAIVTGTEDLRRAKTVLARYVGS